jgi:microcompartment protein CcmK/EutM
MPRSAIWALGFKEKLLCPVDANPPAYSILWTKNGMVIKTTSRLTVMGNGTLVVSQVAMSDSGNYRCTAISSIGNGESEIVQVEVKGESCRKYKKKSLEEYACLRLFL